MFGNTSISKSDVLGAIRRRSGLYQSRGGRRLLGQQCVLVGRSLRDAGWPQIKVDCYDLREFRTLDLEVVDAQLVVGSAATGKFVHVVVERYIEDYQVIIEVTVR